MNNLIFNQYTSHSPTKPFTQPLSKPLIYNPTNSAFSQKDRWTYIHKDCCTNIFNMLIDIDHFLICINKYIICVGSFLYGQTIPLKNQYIPETVQYHPKVKTIFLIRKSKYWPNTIVPRLVSFRIPSKMVFIHCIETNLNCIKKNI